MSYQAAYTGTVWVDLSDKGRLVTSDRDRLDLIHRLSTNAVNDLKPGEGCATVFTNAHARIIDLTVVLNRGETGLVITGARRGDLIEDWLKRNIFWNDRFKIEPASDHQVGIFGKDATAFVASHWPDANALPLYHFVNDEQTLVVRVPGLAGDGYWIIGDQTILDSLTTGIPQATRNDYETLRIEAGLPEVEHELTQEYIPLELGLWEAVSFNKGCYTGQEILARMESRGKLARTMVPVELEAVVDVGSSLRDEDGKQVGTLTSIATLPDQRHIGLAVVKTGRAENGLVLTTGSGIKLKIGGRDN